MKVHPIPHTSFETTRSRFIQILHHCSVSWKITPLYFFSSNLYTLDKKQFSDFWMVGWKFTKFLMSCLKLQVSFSLNFASLFSDFRDNSSILFSGNCTWFGQSAKFQTFDYSHKVSPNLYFDRILLLKGCKDSAKKVQRSYVSWPWIKMQNLKKTWFVVSKMTRI